MTVNELYLKVKQLMFEKSSSTIYDEYILGNLNVILSELYEENNMARMFKDLAPLTECPQVTSNSDTLTYETEYLNEVMPYGLAASFFIDDDLNKFSIFNTKYNNARVKYQRTVSEDKINALSADADV